MELLFNQFTCDNAVYMSDDLLRKKGSPRAFILQILFDGRIRLPKRCKCSDGWRPDFLLILIFLYTNVYTFT